MRGNLLAAGGEDFFHFAKNVQAALTGLLHGFAHDLGRDALDLDIHLHGGDAFSRTRHLEVHIAVVIFRAGNIGEDGVGIAFLDEAHGDPGHWSLEGNARIHQRNRRPANGGHRRRPI